VCDETEDCGEDAPHRVMNTLCESYLKWYRIS
jgi:hypothetical protein